MLFTHKFIATRLLCGFSGSDKYINLNQVEEIHNLYNFIMDDSITMVNESPPVKEISNNIVRFNIIDKILDKSFPMHIKKQDDGLRFTLTEYIKFTKLIPGQIVVISILKNGSSYTIFIEHKEFYKYILEKHTKENYYRILSDNPPRDFITITDNTNIYLSHFGIHNTNDNSLKWSGKNCFSYTSDIFNKKYIGVPFINTSNLICDSFNKIEEII